MMLDKDIVRTPAHLKPLRERSAPKLKYFKAWLEKQEGLHLPGGAMGKAVNFALNNWKPLTLFLKSEQIQIDNNQSGKALRVVALLRKNSLHVGHDDAGANLAVAMTLAAI